MYDKHGPDWPNVMNVMFEIMKERKITRADLVAALRGLRVFPAVVQALAEVKRSQPARVHVLSDGNTFWIAQVLSQSGAIEYDAKRFRSRDLLMR